jgi:hypothetical protein
MEGGGKSPPNGAHGCAGPPSAGAGGGFVSRGIRSYRAKGAPRLWVCLTPEASLLLPCGKSLVFWYAKAWAALEIVGMPVPNHFSKHLPGPGTADILGQRQGGQFHSALDYAEPETFDSGGDRLIVSS